MLCNFRLEMCLEIKDFVRPGNFVGAVETVQAEGQVVDDAKGCEIMLRNLCGM